MSHVFFSLIDLYTKLGLFCDVYVMFLSPYVLFLLCLFVYACTHISPFVVLYMCSTLHLYSGELFFSHFVVRVLNIYEE